ncbi:MAG: amidohydrolase [Chloroflexi bacterium]|nr:amidohydrolase [Chloroflexota bacterium]
MKSFRADVEAMRDNLIHWRRDFHRHPELGFEEFRTAGIVADHLRHLGLEVQSGVGKTGVVGILEGETDGPTVMIRADMDALPINEANDVPYVSATPNKMHACGHDGHTAIAMTVASILSQQRDQLKGRVKFVFQPAEEIGVGAQAMLGDGVLTGPRPDVVLGLHLWNDLPVGDVAITPGPFMASAADFVLTVIGSGGHGAAPHQTHDPIVAASQIVNAAQTVVSRNVGPLEAGVLSFTTIHGGDAFNIIPSEVTLTGTIRTFEEHIYEKMVHRFDEIAQSVATAMACTIKLDIRPLTPAVVNDVQVSQRLRSGFAALDANLTILDNVRTMGAEDVGFFLHEVPGVYFFVGSAQRDGAFPHHHPNFDIDEEALIVGASLLTSAVGDYVF